MNERTIVLDWSGRTLLRMTGKDNASFLHNLCTNDINRLQPGDSCEAFITNVQGKTVGHVIVACRDDTLWLTTVPGQSEALLSHLDRYLITEDVELSDDSSGFSQYLLSGPESAAILKRVFCIDSPSGITSATCRGKDVFVWRMPFCELDTFAVVFSEGEDEFHELLLNVGAERGSAELLERRRIEHRFPWFGIDLTEANLPQELDRDDQAISFNKGCYLGQETVARIDALGHVNKLLVRIRSEHRLEPGAKLSSADKVVGNVTSSVDTGDGQIGLAFVRRELASAGTSLVLPDQSPLSVY